MTELISLADQTMLMFALTRPDAIAEESELHEKPALLLMVSCFPTTFTHIDLIEMGKAGSFSHVYN